MKMLTMRLLDRYLGNVIIFFLMILVKVSRLITIRRKIDLTTAAADNIVIQKYFGMGSILNAFPLINELRKNYPHARIIFLTFDYNRGLLDIAQIVDEIITIRSDRFSDFAIDCFKAVRRMRKGSVDINIDLEFFSKFSMIMSCSSGSPVRVGFFSYFNIRSALLTHPTVFNHYKHISRAYLAMGEALGLDINCHDYRIDLPLQYNTCKEELKQLAGLNDEEPFITINPNASKLCEMRKWPLESFVQLIEKLIINYPQFKYILIGSASERSYVQQIYNRLNNSRRRVVNIAGKTNLNILFAILEKTALLISNDSGPVHLAAAYDTKSVVMFGPETPVLYHPQNANAKVIYKELYCSPCINVLDNKSFEECDSNKCMNSISVEEVLKCVQEQLS